MGRQIKDATTTRTAATLLATDWLPGQAAAGVGFKVSAGDLVAGVTKVINVLNYGATGSTGGASEAVDTAAFQAAAAACVTDGGVILAPQLPAGQSYWLSANYLSSLANSRGSRSVIRARLVVKVPLIIPFGHTVQMSGYSGLSDTYGTEITAHPSGFTGSYVVAIGDPASSDFVHDARLIDAVVDGASIAGMIGIVGYRMQEGCGIERVMIRGCRKSFDFGYASSAGTGINANYIVRDVHASNLSAVATTLSSAASPSDTSVVVASSASALVGDYISIALDAGGPHYAVITGIAGNTISIEPAIAGAAAIGKAVSHASPIGDVFLAPGSIVERITCIASGDTAALAVGIRAYCGGGLLRAVHGERLAATVELGGYCHGLAAGYWSSLAAEISGISLNNAAFAANAGSIVRIDNREPATYSKRVLVSSMSINSLYNGGKALNLIEDLGGSGGSGRTAITLPTAVYGNTMAPPYVIGTYVSGGTHPPTNVVGCVNGRRSGITLAAGVNDDLDPTYAQTLYITPDTGGTSSLTSVLRGWYGREIIITNMASAGSGDNLTITHSAGTGTATARILCGTLADIVVAPLESIILRYGVGSNTSRWLATKL